MHQSRNQLDATAIGLMILFCMLWGVQQVAIKFATPGISPVWQAALRSIGACVLVLGWTRVRGISLCERDGTLLPGLLAGLLFAGEFALLYSGLLFTTASRGVIFLYTAPFIVSLGAVLMLPGEHMRRIQWLGLALAFGGVLVLFGDSLFSRAGGTWVGDAMILLAAVLWASTTLTVKLSRLATAAPEKTLLYQLGISALVLPVLALALGERGVGTLTATVVASMLFQIVGVASLSYVGWFWLVRHYPATRLSAFSFLTPVMGVLAGVVLLDEPLNPGVVFALALVGGGIWLANRPPGATD